VLKNPPLTYDHRMLAKSDLLRQGQADWDPAETGRFAHFISRKVSTRVWFEGHNEERNFVRTISRIMSGHTATHLHLTRS
jgi:hypothetical protein